jgi:Domain of unknown function (DUF4279)
MNPYRYKISLRIRHPSIDPIEITCALRLSPSRAWRAGEPRTTPKGNSLEGNFLDSYWTTEVVEGASPGKALATALAEVLDHLTPHKDFIRRIWSQGGRVELFIGWFLGQQAGDVLESALLARMADLNVDLAFDVYPGDPVMTP